MWLSHSRERDYFQNSGVRARRPRRARVVVGDVDDYRNPRINACILNQPSLAVIPAKGTVEKPFDIVILSEAKDLLSSLRLRQLAVGSPLESPLNLKRPLAEVRSHRTVRLLL